MRESLYGFISCVLVKVMMGAKFFSKVGSQGGNPARTLESSFGFKIGI